jgi:hypothetical protein
VYGSANAQYFLSNAVEGIQQSRLSNNNSALLTASARVASLDLAATAKSSPAGKSVEVVGANHL